MINLNPNNWPEWVLDTLVNDEYSSDDELVQLFMEEGKVGENQAREWVAGRGYYGGMDYLQDCLANAAEVSASREAGTTAAHS